jgi:hypothetical protein
MDIGVLTSAVLASVGAGIWAVRLEGRLNTHEAKDEEAFKGFEKNFSDAKEAIQMVDSKLDRIIDHLIAKKA